MKTDWECLVCGAHDYEEEVGSSDDSDRIRVLGLCQEWRGGSCGTTERSAGPRRIPPGTGGSVDQGGGRDDENERSTRSNRIGESMDAVAGGEAKEVNPSATGSSSDPPPPPGRVGMGTGTTAPRSGHCDEQFSPSASGAAAVSSTNVDHFRSPLGLGQRMLRFCCECREVRCMEKTMAVVTYESQSAPACSPPSWASIASGKHTTVNGDTEPIDHLQPLVTQESLRAPLGSDGPSDSVKSDYDWAPQDDLPLAVRGLGEERKLLPELFVALDRYQRASSGGTELRSLSDLSNDKLARVIACARRFVSILEEEALRRLEEEEDVGIGIGM